MQNHVLSSAAELLVPVGSRLHLALATKLCTSKDEQLHTKTRTWTGQFVPLQQSHAISARTTQLNIIGLFEHGVSRKPMFPPALLIGGKKTIAHILSHIHYSFPPCLIGKTIWGAG